MSEFVLQTKKKETFLKKWKHIVVQPHFEENEKQLELSNKWGLWVSFLAALWDLNWYFRKYLKRVGIKQPVKSSVLMQRYAPNSNWFQIELKKSFRLNKWDIWRAYVPKWWKDMHTQDLGSKEKRRRYNAIHRIPLLIQRAFRLCSDKKVAYYFYVGHHSEWSLLLYISTYSFILLPPSFIHEFTYSASNIVVPKQKKF